MNEKVIHDIKVTETEDGFHIEIKGDKEFLRHWIDRVGTFITHFGERGNGPFGGRGPFGHHYGPFGHEQEPFRGHGPFGRGPFGHGPFGGHGPEQFRGPFGPNEDEQRFGPFGGRGPSPEQREALRQQAREWREQAKELKRQMHEWRHQMRDLHRHGPFGAWDANPEERDAWVRQAQEWRGQGPFGPDERKAKRDEQPHNHGPFGWRGQGEKPKRYDLGPWWDEGEATDELPTV